MSACVAWGIEVAEIPAQATNSVVMITLGRRHRAVSWWKLNSGQLSPRLSRDGPKPPALSQRQPSRRMEKLKKGKEIEVGREANFRLETAATVATTHGNFGLRFKKSLDHQVHLKGCTCV